LAAYVAKDKGWRYYEHVVTSTTQTQDLLWSFDHVRRLVDAQGQAISQGTVKQDDHKYVTPRALWWAFDRASALRRGRPTEGRQHSQTAADPRAALDAPLADAPEEPFAAINAERTNPGVVVLVDEIDKADPDMPNGLLDPLSTLSFMVADIEQQISGDDTSQLLLVVTTNEVRPLPEAFQRRCITWKLETPGRERLVEIARTHRSGAMKADFTADHENLSGRLADELLAFADEARRAHVRAPSTAEYLDALDACIANDVFPRRGDGRWELICRLALTKGKKIGPDRPQT
jgi:MoxR-like ATPase